MNADLQQAEVALRRRGILSPNDPEGFLGTLARCDPALANAIVRPDLLGWGEPSCGWGWQILNVSAQFDSGAANASIPFQLSEGIVETDLWVRKVTYTVQRPNAFAGNVLKAQSDYFNRLNPLINFTLQVNSYCRYLISPTETPLENIEQVFECVCPIGFVLGCNTTLSGTFRTLRAIVDDQVPTIVTITFHVVRLPTRYNSCGPIGSRQAWLKSVQNLQGLGILPPDWERWATQGDLPETAGVQE